LAAAAGCTAPSSDRSRSFPLDSLPDLPGSVPTVWRHDPPASPLALLHPTSVFSTDDTGLVFTLESRSSTPTVISQFGTIELSRLGAERWYRIPRVIHPACGTVAVEGERWLSVGTFGAIDENDGVGTGRFACSVFGSAPAHAEACGLNADDDVARQFATTFRRE